MGGNATEFSDSHSFVKNFMIENLALYSNPVLREYLQQDNMKRIYLRNLTIPSLDILIPKTMEWDAMVKLRLMAGIWCMQAGSLSSFVL